MPGPNAAERGRRVARTLGVGDALELAHEILVAAEASRAEVSPSLALAKLHVAIPAHPITTPAIPDGIIHHMANFQRFPIVNADGALASQKDGMAAAAQCLIVFNIRNRPGLADSDPSEKWRAMLLAVTALRAAAWDVTKWYTSRKVTPITLDADGEYSVHVLDGGTAMCRALIQYGHPHISTEDERFMAAFYKAWPTLFAYAARAKGAMLTVVPSSAIQGIWEIRDSPLASGWIMNTRVWAALCYWAAMAIPIESWSVILPIIEKHA